MLFISLKFTLFLHRWSIQVQRRCWETLEQWNSLPNCLPMWNQNCELSSMQAWTSCSSYLSYSPVRWRSTHMDNPLCLQQVSESKPNVLCITLYEMVKLKVLISVWELTFPYQMCYLCCSSTWWAVSYNGVFSQACVKPHRFTSSEDSRYYPSIPLVRLRFWKFM